MAPLQKRACWGLAVGMVFAVAFTLVFTTMGGIAAFGKDPAFRIIIDSLWISSLAANLLILNLLLRKPGSLDERDQLIMDRAPRIQWLAVVIALVAWTIALNEVYRNPDLMPTDFLYIIFMSVLIISVLGQSLGIILGYWRMDRHG